MGMTYVTATLGNLTDRTRTATLEFLVDSGAIYTVAPANVLHELGIEPLANETFFLANGEKIVRQRGGAYFSLGEKIGVADVIFGEEGDSNLFGATALESLGLALDPFKRELKPMPLVIGGFRPPA
jgi:predicted aspartyl protease